MTDEPAARKGSVKVLIEKAREHIECGIDWIVLITRGRYSAARRKHLRWMKRDPSYRRRMQDLQWMLNFTRARSFLAEAKDLRSRRTP